MAKSQQGRNRPNREARRLALNAGRICVHCGLTGADSNDHLPPKNIFGEPRPSDLIEVPAHTRCNTRHSKDDEYFRLKVGLDQEVADHPVVQGNLPIIMRSLKRPQARGLMQMVAADTRMVNILSPGGLHLGRSLAFKVDLVRIFSVIQRTIRGLYWHETGRRLSDEYAVGIGNDDTLRKEPSDVLEQWNVNIIRPLATVAPKRIGNGVFEYRYLIATDNPDASAWALTFYGKKSFIGLTLPKSDIEAHSRGEHRGSAA